MNERAVRRRLEAERDRLLRLQRQLDDDALVDGGESSAELSPIDQHQADVGSEVFEQEKLRSIRGRIGAELVDVADALTRLDRGGYGRCETCRTAITDDRLEAVPATRFCIDHEVLWEGSQMSFSLPEGVYGDGAAFAEDLAGREATHHLDLLPTEDEPDTTGPLAAEEQALHLVHPGAEGTAAMDAASVERAELNEAGARADERVDARRAEAAVPDLEAALAEELELGRR